MAERDDRVYRVGISGSYGGLNLGDEAILQGIVRQLRQSLPVEITVFSRDPEDTLRRHAVDRALPVRDLSLDEVTPEVARLDLFILGGGGILYDADARLYLREPAIALEKGVPLMVYAVSVGPLEDPAAQELVRNCLSRAEVVTVRDRLSRQALEQVGVRREVLVTADPALLLERQELPADALKREGLDQRHRLVAMSVREPGKAAPDLDEEQYHALLADAADFMVDRFDADVVFVPLERGKFDMQHSHAVVSRMLRAQRAFVLRGEYTSGQLLSLLDHFRFAVGMRLHFLIFAALRGIPFVALPYATKVAGFLEDLQLVFPPLKQVSAGRLLAYIDHSWDHRRSIHEQIVRLVPSLQERARQNNRIAVELLQRIRARIEPRRRAAG